MFSIFGKKPKKYQTDVEQAKNLENQLQMAPETLAQLREYGVTELKQLKLEFFFYTDTKSKAEGLNAELIALGYDSQDMQSAGDKTLQVVTGWTLPITMTEKEVGNWIENMCSLANRNDAEFDGWGTSPEQ